MSSKLVFATASAVVLGGRQVVVGEAWHADDELVKQFPSLFTDDDRFVRSSGPRKVESAEKQAPVEQATKAPGEKRPTRRA